MKNTCGHSRGLKHNSKELVEVPGFRNDYRTSATFVQRELYSSYLGKVNVYGMIRPNSNNILLEGPVLVGSKQITTKVIDVDQHKLDMNKYYSPNTLQHLKPQEINVSDNHICFYLTLICRKLIQTNAEAVAQIEVFLKKTPIPHENSINIFLRSNFAPEGIKIIKDAVSGVASQGLKPVYNKLLNFNSGVDCFFHTQNYILWIYEAFGQEGINTPQDYLITLNGFVDDNAFFTGEYLAICKGRTEFYDMATIDVIGHEVSHGLVQTLSGLEYQGESGAMNEGFADAFGTGYEFFLYKKLNEDADKSNDILGEKDFLIGEDQARKMPWLRNMENPNKAAYPQPKEYKGEFWYDGEGDNGGTHTNSGVPNYCFYNVSKCLGVDVASKLWYETLKKLQPKSQMLDFADQLLKTSRNNPDVLASLALCNLAETPQQPEEEEKTTTPSKVQVFLLPVFEEPVAIITQSLLKSLLTEHKKEVKFVNV